MNFVPLAGKVLLKPEEDPLRTKSGLFIPDIARDKKNGFARVVAVGDGVEAVVKGDRILAETYAGREVRVEGQDLLIVDEQEILAVLFGQEL